MKRILSGAAVILLLSGCGGGGGSGETLLKKVEGNWQRQCLYVASIDNSNISEVTITDTQIINTFTEYPTIDCSGEPEYVEISTYDKSTTGTSANSFCVADNINVTLTSISVNGQLLTDEEAADYTSAYNKTKYDIACNVDNQLYFGLEDETYDTESEDGRPVEVDTQEDAILVATYSTDVEGYWEKECIYNERFDYSYIRETEMTPTQMIRTFTEYETTNCSGLPDYIEVADYELSVTGVQATASCIADKIDRDLKQLTVNGEVLTDAQAMDYTSEFGRITYDLVCNSSNRLLFGLDDETYDRLSDATRPIEMDEINDFGYPVQ